MNPEQWAELVRGITLALSALGTVFGGLISVRQFNQTLKIANLERRVETLQLTNGTLLTEITGLKGVVIEYTNRLNTALDTLGIRNTEVAKGKQSLESRDDRIDNLRSVIKIDGDRATLDAGLEADNKAKKDYEDRPK